MKITASQIPLDVSRDKSTFYTQIFPNDTQIAIIHYICISLRMNVSVALARGQIC